MTMTVGGTSGLVFPDSSTQNTAATGFGFKNRIINGAMMIDQRNAGASVSAGVAYPVDRFFISSINSNFTGQRSSTAPAAFSNSCAITVSSSASPSAGDYRQFIHSIEGYNVADFGLGTSAASTFTLSFWVRSSVTGTFSAGLMNSAANRSYVFTYTVNSANTWEQKTVTIAGDTSGTWLTDNGIGLQLRMDLGSGSTYTTSAGSWQSGLYFKATGSTNLVGTNGATFYITGVQLEKGSTATSFDYRPYGQELALCQRYYEILTTDSASICALTANYDGVNSWHTWHFKTKKRTTATVSKVGGTWAGVTGTLYNGDTQAGIATIGGYGYIGATSGTTVLAASAEL